MPTFTVEIKENPKSMILIRKQISIQDCTSYITISVIIMMLVRMCWIGYIMSKCFAVFDHILVLCKICQQFIMKLTELVFHSCLTFIENLLN